MSRKLSLSRAWDETKEVLRKDGGLLSTLALALFVLPGVINELSLPQPKPGQLPAPGMWILILVIVILIGIVGQLAVVRLSAGSRTTVGEAIAHGARRALPYVGAMLLWTLPLALVSGLLAGLFAQSVGLRAIVVLIASITALFLVVRFLLASAVASLEPVGPLAILRRTWDLSRGHGWRLLAFAILLVIAYIVVMVAVGALASLLAAIVFGTPEPMSVGALVVALISQIALAPLTVIYMVMISRMYLQLTGQSAEASVPSSGT